MRNKKTAYLITSLFLAITLLACSKSKSSEAKISESSNLTKLNIYLYKDNPSKTQPEQIASIDNVHSLSTWDSAFEEKGKETLPAKDIKGIFLYEKEYAKGKSMQVKCFIFVKFEDGSGYYKEFLLTEKFEVQNYTKQSGEELIKKLGRDNWGRNPNEGSDHDLWLNEQLKQAFGS